MARAQSARVEHYPASALQRDNVKRLPPVAARAVRKVAVAKPSPWSFRPVDKALPWLLPLLLLGLWYLGVERGWLSEQVLPPPAYVYESFADLVSSGDLWLNASASLQRVVVGFALGSLLGLAFGVAMGLSRTLEDYLLPTFNALVQIPVLGWLPFALLLFGIGETLKYVLIAKAALVPITLCTLQAFRQAPRNLLEVGQVYGFSRWQSIIAIVLPAAIPTLFTGFRLGFTKAWLSLVVVELVASSEGLGYLIVYGRQLFQLDLVMAAVVMVGALGLLFDRAFDYAEKRLDRGRPRLGGQGA